MPTPVFRNYTLDSLFYTSSSRVDASGTELDCVLLHRSSLFFSR
jgi:hypothetical protein